MRRTPFILAGAAIGAALLARGCASGRCGLDPGEMIERMPDRSPRKWMFTSIRTIRENTDRILQLLEDERGAPADTPTRSAAAT